MATNEDKKQERDWLKSLRQARTSFDSNFNTLMAGDRSTFALSAFNEYIGRVQTYLSQFAPNAKRLGNVGLTTLLTELEGFQNNLSEIKKIFKEMIDKRREFNAETSSYVKRTDDEILKTMTEMDGNRKKAFEEANNMFNDYLLNKPINRRK